MTDRTTPPSPRTNCTPMSTANCRPTGADAVDAWLATHPDDAALVAAWRAQADAIRARYGAVASEPVPERLALDSVLRNGSAAGARSRRRR